MIPTVQIPKRFYSLDVIRGLAALTVVVSHWNLFFYSGTNPGIMDQASLPLYPLLFFLYDSGGVAVNLFFSLSGFIFYWLYSERISNKAINAWNFSILRFSRLYPLHFITLLIMATSQTVYFYRNGDFFVNGANDIYHFILNIFLVPAWGFQKAYSFNSPIWSVSIEVLLYLIFFIVCEKIPVRSSILFILTISGLILMNISNTYYAIGRGIFFFFIGGIVYFVYLEIIKRKLGKTLEKYLKGMVIVVCIVAILYTKYHFKLPSYLQKSIIFYGHQISLGSQLLTIFYGVLFAFIILTLAIVETRKGHFGRRISFIGNISYSSYLIHFPLQLIIIIAFDVIGIDVSFFYTNISLLVFFMIVILLSIMSNRFFEIPAQKIIRGMLVQNDISKTIDLNTIKKVLKIHGK